jgi:uncharacterized protein
MRFSYAYFMTKDPDRVRAVAAEHAAYWQGLDLPSYLGGPFADRSGGLITFEARSGEEAHRFAANDPFVREELLADRWLKEWHVE